jgi:putative hydrolase of the HAD superfamily
MSTEQDVAPRIEAVIFDYGEVLCFPPRLDEIERMARMFGVEPKLFPPLWEKNRGAYDRGDLTPEVYWDMLAADAGQKMTPELFAEVNELDSEMWGRENPRMVEWMRAISAAGIKVGLLSNMHPGMVRYVRDKFEWLGCFASAIFSADVRLVKPDAAIYQHTLEKLGVAAENALFIDDREGNIRAARALGMHTVHFHSMAGLRDELKALRFPILPAFSAADELPKAAIKM